MDGQQLAADIGEIKGQLKSLDRLLGQSQEATSLRIADLQRSVDLIADAIDTRLSEHQQSVNRRFKKHDEEISNLIKISRRDGMLAGGGTSGIIIVVVEALKYLTKAN